MVDNTNRQKIIEAIWENPAKAFGCEFRTSGRYQENRHCNEYGEAGKIRIIQNATLTNITVLYNGSSRPEKLGVFDYLGDYVLHTTGFKETLIRCAELYNIKLEFSVEERQRLTRAALAREVVPSLIEALRLNPQGEAATYLRDVRGMEQDGVHFGELSKQSIKRVTDALRLKNYAYTYEDLNALGLTVNRANQGYNLAIPYYRNGQVTGFVFRNTREAFTGPKYLYSEGLGRGGYCDTLTTGEPAVFVEGQMDAIRMTQAGVRNVVAIGGASISDDIAKLLYYRNVTQITYVPDLEYNDQGEQKTKIITDALDKFLSVKVDGEQVVKNLYVAELDAPQGANLNGLKIDADTYGKTHGAQALAEVIKYAVSSWDWELSHLLATAQAKERAGGDINISWFQNEFDKIYNRCGNFYERQRIRDHVKNNAAFAAFGVTPEALTDKDEWNRNRDYNNRIKAGAQALAEAIEKGANPATVGDIVAKLSEAQGTNTRDEWEQQLAQTFDDELKAITDQPDTIKTRWELGNININGDYIKYENIEYWPADLSVYCAPTSHGKTMFLMQSALDTVQDTGGAVLYVSCEEKKWQLLERALNVYLNIDTTPTGKDENGNYCFIRGTRKKAIKAALMDATTCYGYTDELMGVSEHFQALKRRIMHGVQRYAAEVRPRLKFVHSDGTAESISSNVVHYVEQYRAEGLDISAVFVDYMQLLTSESKHFNRTDELKDVCRALKVCAQRLDIPFIIAAQLNREAIRNGIDEVTVANIGEGADIERIAHDVYFVWQIDKTKRDKYFEWKAPKKGEHKGEEIEDWRNNAGDRAKRIFTPLNKLRPYDELTGRNSRELKRGYMYVEQLKARDGKSDGWGLFPFDGERGRIERIDKNKMAD